MGNIDTAVKELVKLGCNVRMRDDQLVPLRFPGDHNTLNMIISLTMSSNKKNKSFATTGAAFGLLRMIFKNTTYRPRKTIDIKNVLGLAKELRSKLSVRVFFVQHQALLCLRPLHTQKEMLDQAMLAAVHVDVEREDATEMKLRQDTSTNPLLATAFRSLGYVLTSGNINSFETSSSSNPTTTLDVVLSGGTDSPLGCATPTFTVLNRCSTNDIKTLQQRFELLAHPFRQCAQFYDQHRLILLDLNDCQGKVSHMNSVCIGMHNNPDLFFCKISLLFMTEISKRLHSSKWCTRTIPTGEGPLGCF